MSTKSSIDWPHDPIGMNDFHKFDSWKTNVHAWLQTRMGKEYDFRQLLVPSFKFKAVDHAAKCLRLFELLDQIVKGGRMYEILHDPDYRNRGDKAWTAIVMHYTHRYAAARLAYASQFCAQPKGEDMVMNAYLKKIVDVKIMISESGTDLQPDFHYDLFTKMLIRDADGQLITPIDFTNEMRVRLTKLLADTNELDDDDHQLQFEAAKNSLSLGHLYDILAWCEHMFPKAGDGQIAQVGASAHPAPAPTQGSVACFNWKKNKNCRYGQRCKFEHDGPGAKSEHGRKRFKNDGLNVKPTGTAAGKKIRKVNSIEDQRRARERKTCVYWTQGQCELRTNRGSTGKRYCSEGRHYYRAKEQEVFNINSVANTSVPQHWPPQLALPAPAPAPMQGAAAGQAFQMGAAPAQSTPAAARRTLSERLGPQSGSAPPTPQVAHVAPGTRMTWTGTGFILSLLSFAFMMLAVPVASATASTTSQLGSAYSSNSMGDGPSGLFSRPRTFTDPCDDVVYGFDTTLSTVTTTMLEADRIQQGTVLLNTTTNRLVTVESDLGDLLTVSDHDDNIITISPLNLAPYEAPDPTLVAPADFEDFEPAFRSDDANSATFNVQTVQQSDHPEVTHISLNATTFVTADFHTNLDNHLDDASIDMAATWDDPLSTLLPPTGTPFQRDNLRQMEQALYQASVADERTLQAVDSITIATGSDPITALADSGAAYNICPDVKSLHNAQRVQNMWLGDAGAHRHVVTHKGTMRLALWDSVKQEYFTLDLTTMVCPTIKSTLINTTYLRTDLNLSATINPRTGWTWRTPTGNQYTLTASGRQEFFEGRVILPTTAPSLSESTSNTHSVQDNGSVQTGLYVGADAHIGQPTPRPAKRPRTERPVMVDVAPRPQVDATSSPQQHNPTATPTAATGGATAPGGAAGAATAGLGGSTASTLPDPVQPMPDPLSQLGSHIPTTPDDRQPLPVTPAFSESIKSLAIDGLIDLIKTDSLNKNQLDAVRIRLAQFRVITTKGQEDLFLQLHHKLGHISFADTLAVARRYNIPVGKYAGIVCDTCHRWKSKRQPVPKSTRASDTHAPLSAWSVDVYGPFAVSTFGRNRYILSAVDKSTRLAISVPMPSINQGSINAALQEFCVEAHRLVDIGKDAQLALHLGPRIQTDSASVFKSQSAKAVLKREGFNVVYHSAPYTQARNGTVERFFGTVVTSARCMLNAASLQDGLLPEAIVHATRVYNVTPHSALGTNVSPMEFLTGSPPDLSIFRAFGAPVWIHKHVRTKNETKGIPGFYLGIDPANGANLVSYHSPASLRHVRTSAHHVTFDDRIPARVLNGVVPTLTETSSLSCTTESVLECSTHDVSTIRADEDPIALAAVQSGKMYYSESQALKSSEGHLFPGCLHTEVDELRKMGCLIPISAEHLTEEELHKPMGTMTLFYTKTNAFGETVGKCRLVAKGKDQVQGVDYDLKSNHTPTWATVRCHVALQPSDDPRNVVLVHADLKKFFGHASNERPDGQRVIARLPAHARIHLDGKTYEYVVLDRALYGQTNSGYLAERKLWRFLKENGWTQSYDPAAWTKGGLRVVIWVDDLLIRGTREAVDAFLVDLNACFPGVTHNDVSHFLGHTFTLKTDGSVAISAEKYIDEICKRFNVVKTKDTPLSVGCNPTTIPMPPADERDKRAVNLFQQIVGCAAHLQGTLRPDISYAVSTLAQASHNPGKKHLKEIHHTLQYLNGTPCKGISYQVTENARDNNTFKMYVDASYADDKDFRSHTGYIGLLGNAPVTWGSRTQKFVTTSSQEAEVVAAAAAVKEVIFIQCLLDSWDCPEWPCKVTEPITIFEDNMGAIQWFQNGLLGSRAKHYGTRLYFIRNHIATQLIKWQHISTKLQIADMLTKSLASPKHSEHTDKVLTTFYKQHVNSVMSDQSQYLFNSLIGCLTTTRYSMGLQQHAILPSGDYAASIWNLPHQSQSHF